jgi:hypothetical protein
VSQQRGAVGLEKMLDECGMFAVAAH